MTNIDLNPRAVVGEKKPPEYAQKVTDEMRAEYGALEQSVTLALEEARTLPKEINDDKIMGTFARLIKKLRDTAARAEAFRVAEAEPHYRAKQAVDGFFFGLIDKCARRDRKAQPGAADILQARLDDYNQRKLRAEQERLAREEAERRRVPEPPAAKARAAARVAAEPPLAADRPPPPHT